MSCYLKGKDKILIRLKRMEGQVRGIQRMVQQGKYCSDILTQLSSVMAASQKLGLIVLENHIQGKGSYHFGKDHQQLRLV
ncbi:CsoR family transcriptional regulator, copper-sensing transcriptional repressor [Candidatus Hakubella thermalkaliphila]|uniref:CsoR family transcriptional regulator, copper-sensing transcriptional repressor n=1 Tax=Candidatus Hakubella thermalkaliphila TaxID=2754717 RepID=A0A6V8PGH3_9ACTN|nr:CsoR family transcriptional regulator, copper-sensing transcriptional repressor [Candidatus Hakubella thermalkaliphila]